MGVGEGAQRQPLWEESLDQKPLKQMFLPLLPSSRLTIDENQPEKKKKNKKQKSLKTNTVNPSL